MNALYVMLISLFVVQSALGQAESTSATNKHTLRRTYIGYDEEVMYFGKRDQYFTVRMYLKNGSLFRLDTYTLLPKTLANGFQLDSLSRIIRYGPTKIMYPNGKVYISCEYKENVLHGPFMVLYEDGSVKRREYYRSGRISKSECYTPDGMKQTCTPFYKAAEFQGKPNELAAYLKQKLDGVIDGEKIRSVTAMLTINEIGQVTTVRALVNNDPANKQVDAVSYVQQIIRNMPNWSPDKLNWKPAMNDGIATTSTCVVSVFRYYGGGLQCRIVYQL